MNRHYERAIILRDLGKLELAEAEFRKSIAESPDDGFIRARLARLLSSRGKSDEMLAEAQEACRLAPDSADSHWALSSVLLDRDEMTAAEKSAREAVRLAPEEPVYSSLLGIVQLNLKQNQNALQTATEVLAIEPAELDGLRVCAMALHRLGRFDEAEEVARNGLEFYPTSDDLMRIRGRALLEQGQSQEALDHFLEARRLAPAAPWDRSALLAALVRNSWVARSIDQIGTRWKRMSVTYQFIVGTGVLAGTFIAVLVGIDYPALSVFAYLFIAACIVPLSTRILGYDLIAPFIHIVHYRDLGLSRRVALLKYTVPCILQVLWLMLLVMLYSGIFWLVFVVYARFARWLFAIVFSS